MRICILSYNHPELTARTVESVLKYCTPSSVLLIHNGSTEAHRTVLIQKFPQIEHLILESNRGFTGGTNSGLLHCFKNNKTWVLFLTNDCQLLTTPVEPKNKMALYGPIIYARKIGKIDSIGGCFNTLNGKLSHIKTLSEFLKYQNPSPKPQIYPYIPGTAFWIHSDLFNSVGKFDESLGTYWEDVDYSMRVLKMGYQLEIDNQTEILHSIGKTCHKHSEYTLYLFQRNRKIISKRYIPPGLLNYFKLICSIYKDWLIILFKNLNKKDLNKISLLFKAYKES